MDISNKIRSQILIDALPHIQKYHDKIVVVKYGGNAMTNAELKEAVMSDIVLLSEVGIKVVLVHGGGPEINAMLKRVGIESKFINGLRYTDAETIDIVKMVLCGKVNKELVCALQLHGGKALGLCGCDGQMILAQKLDSEVDLGFVGDIKKVTTKPIVDALNNGYVPIISTVGVGEDGQSYNINADTAAARIASCLRAEKLILMTDIVGLLEDKDESFFKELVEHHVSGQLKVAPEHCSAAVLDRMGKPHIETFNRFVKRFYQLTEKAGKEQYLVPYLMSSHPGSTLKDAVQLAVYLKKNRIRPEQVQDFYPTPGTVSTCMFYTGIDPLSGKQVFVPKDPKEKAMQRALLQYYRPEMRPQVIEALKRAGREDLIGTGPDCLVPPQREASAGGGRRLQEPRRGKNDERRGNVKSGRENAPAGKGKTRGKRAR